MQTLSNAVQISHLLLKEALLKAKIIVDATAGNGNDTLFLAENALDNAKIYAFDIQQEALNNAELKLQNRYDSDGNLRSKNLQVKFIHDSHEHIAAYVNENVDLAIFNLGYLPGGNHSVTTKLNSTLKALTVLIEKANINAHIAIVVYPGHEEGAKEAATLKNFLAGLDKKYFTVGHYQMINHTNNAPRLYWIEKVGEKD